MEFSTSVTSQLSQQGESNRKMKSKDCSDLAYEKAFEKILDCINSLHGLLYKYSPKHHFPRLRQREKGGKIYGAFGGFCLRL